MAGPLIFHSANHVCELSKKITTLFNARRYNVHKDHLNWSPCAPFHLLNICIKPVRCELDELWWFQGYWEGKNDRPRVELLPLITAHCWLRNGTSLCTSNYWVRHRTEETSKNSLIILKVRTCIVLSIDILNHSIGKICLIGNTKKKQKSHLYTVPKKSSRREMKNAPTALSIEWTVYLQFTNTNKRDWVL